MYYLLTQLIILGGGYARKLPATRPIIKIAARTET
jgi:hypothetical protein